jgi:hypothetical protein
MQSGLPHRRKLLLFVVLSAIDLFLTWRLLDRPGTPVYEINPFARWSWEHIGWFGLIGFKTAVVGVAASAALIIARRRPRTASRVLTFGCLAAALVVGYSLFVDWTASNMPEAQVLTAEAIRFERQENELRKRNAYRPVLDRAAADLAEDRCTLPEAVDRLLDTERGRDPAWLNDIAKKEGNLTPEAALAVQVILMAVDSRHQNPEESRALAARLHDELRSRYGSPAGERLAFYIPRPRPAGEFIIHADGGFEIRVTLSFQPES